MKVASLIVLAITPVVAQQPKFDVADLHISPTAHGFAQNFGGDRHDCDVNRDATMLKLIASAYGVSEEDIAGGPGWLSSDLFDLVAKIPDGNTPATVMKQHMFAAWLAFGLTLASTGPKSWETPCASRRA